MSSSTPDLLPRFQKQSHLDKTEHGTRGHDMAPVIKGAKVITQSPEGPAFKMVKPQHAMGTNCEPGLGAGGGNLGDAVRSIKSGARAPRADVAHIRKG
jgi:hypothetical protein